MKKGTDTWLVSPNIMIQCTTPHSYWFLQGLKLLQ